MKTHTFLVLIILVAGSAYAQDNWREKLDPKATEVWKPVPTVTASPVMAAPPSDATVLFDGKDLSQWVSVRGGDAGWKLQEGAMVAQKGAGSIKSKQTFGDVQLHLEWRTPSVVTADGQGRGNSGVYLQERYEVQVLDSYENQTYANGQAGSVYKQHIPLVNASRKPGEWQSYDIVFTAPRYSEKGTLIVPAYITVFHNGVLIQNHVPVMGPSEYQGLPVAEQHGKASILLQDHGDPVSYRNIWVREL